MNMFLNLILAFSYPFITIHKSIFRSLYITFAYLYLSIYPKVPKDDIDRLNTRDNLKLAMEAGQQDSNPLLLAAGKGDFENLTGETDHVIGL